MSRSSDLGQFLRDAEVVADVGLIRDAAGKFWLTLAVWGQAGSRLAGSPAGANMAPAQQTGGRAMRPTGAD